MHQQLQLPAHLHLQVLVHLRTLHLCMPPQPALPLLHQQLLPLQEARLSCPHYSRCRMAQQPRPSLHPLH
jgi:hypothetical protein